ncbi:MAG: hypothetical protein KF764_19650 [Labilithrix sp.]|nr:hypothetical protein [Labilithrix sp.]MBX3222693.1 hypothetical protein [Labilithrix sp.]
MSATPPALQALLDVFASDLADVRFGDLDATTLAGLASEADAAADAVVSAQVLVDVARDRLQERQDALLQQAQRALAYARVYAESDVALRARLDAIALPRPARRARPDAEAVVLSPDQTPARRPRGRPRKTPAVAPLLEGFAATAE